MPTFTGTSTTDDFGDALLRAFAAAKIGLRTDLIHWHLLSVDGLNGGFAQQANLTVTIRADVGPSNVQGSMSAFGPGGIPIIIDSQFQTDAVKADPLVQAKTYMSNYGVFRIRRAEFNDRDEPFGHTAILILPNNDANGRSTRSRLRFVDNMTFTDLNNDSHTGSVFHAVDLPTNSAFSYFFLSDTPNPVGQAGFYVGYSKDGTAQQFKDNGNFFPSASRFDNV